MVRAKALPLAAIAALVLGSVFLLAQQRGSNLPPSWTAVTPGSIRAAGGPTGPIPTRHPPVFPGNRHHPRRGFAGYGFGYAVPYPYGYYPDMDQPAEPEPPAPAAEPERPGLTIFEHNGRAIDQAVETPPQQPAPQPAAAPQDEKPGPPTILVFRDGHQQEIQNYAILGDKLIVLSDERAKRIPLAELDLDATIKANDQQGVEFRLPGKS